MRNWVLQPAEPVYRWTVGEVTVTKISEGVLEGGLDVADEREGFLAQGTREALLGIDWLRPDFITADGAVRLAFHALVIETPTHRIVVDTCVGNDKHRPSHHFWQHRKKPKGKPRSESLRRCQQGQIQNTRAGRACLCAAEGAHGLVHPHDRYQASRGQDHPRQSCP